MPDLPSVPTSYVTPADPAPRDPERLLVTACLQAPGEPPRYLLLRWPDWPPPALLSMEPPSDGSDAAVASAVETVLATRLGVHCIGTPRLSAYRVPVRMRQPRRGGEGTGWLRAVAVRVEGEPRPDGLLEAVVALPLDEALAALTTDVERRLLDEGARLLNDPHAGSDG